MKMTTRSVVTLPMLLAPQPPRQLGIAFETPALADLTAGQRSTAMQALATMLLQAAGVRQSEDDDVEH
jgi:hypothetical protein